MASTRTGRYRESATTKRNAPVAAHYERRRPMEFVLQKQRHLPVVFSKCADHGDRGCLSDHRGRSGSRSDGGDRQSLARRLLFAWWLTVRGLVGAGRWRWADRAEIQCRDRQVGQMTQTMRRLKRCGRAAVRRRPSSQAVFAASAEARAGVVVCNVGPHRAVALLVFCEEGDRDGAVAVGAAGVQGGGRCRHTRHRSTVPVMAGRPCALAVCGLPAGVAAVPRIHPARIEAAPPQCWQVRRTGLGSQRQLPRSERGGLGKIGPNQRRHTMSRYWARWLSSRHKPMAAARSSERSCKARMSASS